MTSRQLPLFSDTNPSVRNDTAALIEPHEANDAALTRLTRSGKRRPTTPRGKADRIATLDQHAKSERTQTLKNPQHKAIALQVGQVAQRYGVSRPKVWRWVKSNPGFPLPVHIGPGTTRWYLADLEIWDELHRRSALKGAGK